MLALMYSRLSIHQLCFSGQVYGTGENKYGGGEAWMVRIIVCLGWYENYIYKKK